MSLAFLIDIIIALVIAGFILWAAGRIISVIPMQPPIPQIINVILLVAAVAIVLFYVVIPLLHLLAGANLHLPR